MTSILIQEKQRLKARMSRVKGIEKIIVDIGIGSSKTSEDDLEVLRSAHRVTAGRQVQRLFVTLLR